jgi:hypothetical protein
LPIDSLIGSLLVMMGPWCYAALLVAYFIYILVAGSINLVYIRQGYFNQRAVALNLNITDLSGGDRCLTC